MHRLVAQGPPRRHARVGARRHAATMVGHPARGVLGLQRTAGNRAVTGLLQVQADREHPPIKDVYATGTLGQAQWRSTFRKAVDATAKGDRSAVTLYTRLLADAATVAGITALRGFDPRQIHLDDGTTRPGLNLSLHDTGGAAHVAWIDSNGKWGVPFALTNPLPTLAVAMKVGVHAFHEDKAASLHTIRHEMVHVEHRLMTLEAAERWHTSGRKVGFDTWVARNAKALRLSAADVVLVKKGAKNGWADTEVLAYVEGFMTMFHLAPATKAGSLLSFFELLGAVQTDKGLTWQQADDAVKAEATAQLRTYHASLDRPHQARWREWVTEGVEKHKNDDSKQKRDGRKAFFVALATFVR